MELDAIVAVMLGGTPFGGGRATMVGSLAGAGLLTLLAVELNLMHVTPYLQQVIKGALVVVAIAVYSQRRRTR
jgi:ribose transport system permease protein